MSNIKVIDVNEEAKQEAVEEPVQIEEATEQVEHEPTNEVVDNPPVEEVEKTKEEPKQEPKPKAKPKASDRVDCKTCGKNLSYKNYRYRHEKICTAEPKPVKPQAKPKAKALPKPKIEVKEEPKREILKDISNQVIESEASRSIHQPQLSPYDIARQSYIQMKEELRAKKIEKINNFKSKMF